MQDQTVVPAAVFCAVALAAARDISDNKQTECIELLDVAIGRSMVLETSSVEIEISLALHSPLDSVNDETDSIQAEFTLNGSTAQDKDVGTVARGGIRIAFANHEPSNTSTLFSRKPKTSGLVPVNIKQFYDSLSEVGLGYSGPFRALTSAERRMDFSCAVVATKTDEAPPGESYLLHPTRLEAYFQTLLLAFAAPRDGSLWTAFTPTKLGRITVYPNSCVGPNTLASVNVDTHLTEYTPGYESELPTITGDMSVYNSETWQLQIRVEGLTMSPMIPPTEKQDKLLYLKTTWQQDILSGVVFDQHENTSCYEDLGLSQVQKYILTGARQISHRYAKLRILQVGTSSIGLVQAMHQELGKGIDSYVILDASDRAIEDMKREMISDDLNIRFGVHNIARDVRTLDETTSPRPTDLGFFDLIILPKAYKEQTATLNAIRSLLKPGGFLLMVMTAMATEGIPPKATDTARKEIHDMLQSAGFSGVESLKMDPEEDPSFVILSQALDDQISFLRAPLDSTPTLDASGRLLVLGGTSQEIAQFIEIIQSKLRCVWDGEIMVIGSLADLNSRDLDQVEAVLSLTELDQSVLEFLSHDTFEGLHLLLGKSNLVLWVTHGARNQNPYQSGTIGLVRAVQAESPEKVLQLLDLDTIDGNESLVAESFLRLIGGVLMRDNGSKMLWTVEPEVSVQGGRLLIPRVLFDEKRNDRLSSLRRRVKARAPFEKQPGTLVRPIDPSGLFSPSKTYILVGLSGHIGQSITRWMVKNGARHIVITSRNPKNEEHWKEELEKQDANILIEAADVTNKQDMVNLRNHILSTMPPIGGLANGAMVQSNCSFPDLTYDALQEVLRPKVDGSVILDEVFSDDDLDFFLLFSSISAVTGQPFQANYDAANSFMTGLAFQRRARNLAASVIDFGPIIGLGFIQKIDSSGGSDAMISILRGLDYMLISERELHQLLAEAILAGKSNESPGITAGLETVSDNAPFWHKSLLFSHIIQKP
ncbi:hypothetical protein DL770_006493 [Monosporascus sp. CRB-9-2]|nr:hypothetical protein DL770_006493 [Monosporascus sp. CRB-9-2]